MKNRFFNTIAFRLTLWYAGIFIVSSCIMFFLFSFSVYKIMLQKIDLDLKENVKVFSQVISREGINGARRFSITKARAAGEKVVFYRLLYSTGEVFASSHMLYWKNIKADKNILNQVILSNKHSFQTVETNSKGDNIRILYDFVAQGVILQTGVAMESYLKFLNIFKIVFAGSMGFILLFSAIIGWFMAKKALSGVEKITETAKKVSGASLDSRVPETGNEDELDQLAKTFNQMLNRIEDLIISIKEMGDNIAHDLKSPVTRIRGLAEITILNENSIEEYKKMAASTIEESDRLLDMINTMLLISKAESGDAQFVFEEINISEIIDNACELFTALAETNNIDFKYQIKDNIIINGDKKMLQRAFSNFLDNAFKYTEKYNSVEVLLSETEKKFITIEIKDTGIGIEKINFEKIFNRFYRIDPSRSEKGSGLGLSLSLAIIKEHGGKIDIVSEKGFGSKFIITLPNGNLQVI
ncbi:MAG: HAMP domain-containing protein [Desulfobacteraceae bacterium]|nr:HAMP domain-containing protein [Desulfobacteraceae bacterium]